MAQLTERSIWIRVFALTADLVMTVVAFVTAFAMRTEIRAIYFFGSAQSVEAYYDILAMILLIWWFLFDMQKLHSFGRGTSLGRECGSVIRTVLLGTVILFAVAYTIRFEMPPRSTIALFVIINTFLLCVNHFFFRNLKEFLRREGGFTKKILVVGSGEKAQRFIASTREHAEWKMDLVGFIDFDKTNIGKRILGSVVLNTHDRLLDVLHEHVIDEVVFAVPTQQLSQCTDMLALCEQEGIRAVILSNFFSSLVAQIQTEIQYDQPVLIYSTTRHKEWQLLVKRIFDVAFSAVLLIFALPVVLVLVLLIKLNDNGPILYWQNRVGQNGDLFRFPKFRSMVVNAEALQASLMEKNEMKGAAFKLKNDPRITKVGRFMRKYSLDELPQLWSVLKGDMAVVGPRPPLESELPKFDSWHRRKLSVKPGLTCLWQVSGRSTITEFDEWVKLDLAYIDNWSLLLDFKILAMTIPAVLSGRGAS